MSTTSFDEHLNLICDKIIKTDTNMRKAINPVERLAVSLR
jgi:small nuclear ribonucleoprotein (snRNP)-like protein